MTDNKVDEYRMILSSPTNRTNTKLRHSFGWKNVFFSHILCSGKRQKQMQQFAIKLSRANAYLNRKAVVKLNFEKWEEK